VLRVPREASAQAVVPRVRVPECRSGARPLRTNCVRLGARRATSALRPKERGDRWTEMRFRAGNRRRPGEPRRVASVYVLRCGDDSLYRGWTTDIQRRLAAHRSGTASRYTRSRRPVELVVVIAVADRSAALREEARIKRLPRAAKLQLIEATLGAA
jgi:putative endonuclease